MAQSDVRAQDYTMSQDYAMAQDYAVAQDYVMAQEYMSQDDTEAQVQSNRVTNNPYRVSVMPDDVPSMDVSEQRWGDSATDVPEEEESEDSSLDGTYQEMPSPTATKTGIPGLPEADHHLSKHVLGMYKTSSAMSLPCCSGWHSKTVSRHT